MKPVMSPTIWTASHVSVMCQKYIILFSMYGVCVIAFFFHLLRGLILKALNELAL